MSKLHTAIGKENEIFQEEDITFGYDSAINNVVTAINSFLSGSEKNIVIGGKVEPYSGGGMNIQISPIFALNKSDGYCCIDTDSIYPIAVEESDMSQNRIDIVEIKSELTGYDVQDRKFQDPSLDIQTTESIETKKQLSVTVKVKKGEIGSSSAPETDSGYIKIAEIFIPAAVNAISTSFIYNVTAIQEGDENASWTNESDVTFNPGFVYDLLPKFLVSHLPDGSIKNGMVDANKLDLGTGTKQVKGSVIPNGQSMNIHGEGYTNDISIAYMINALASAVNSLFRYSNDLLSRYRFAKVVPVAASTENVNLSVGGSKTIDGYLCTENTAVLLKNQSDPTENGVYKVGSTWTRYPGYDAVTPTALRNTLFVISNGSENIGKVYYCNNDLVTIGVDDIAFTESIYSPKDYPKTIMVRDASGRSKVSDPADNKDIANKGFVESITGLLSNLTTSVKTNIVAAINDHKSKTGTNAHGATVAATPGQIITRDDNGRAQVADPAADDDIANKGWVTGLRQLFFDVSHPVGDIFIQYPSIGSFVTKTPQQLFNVDGVSSTWEEVDYGGVFFRANGGLSETFGSQTEPQKDAFQGHEHSGVRASAGTYSYVSSDGVAGQGGGNGRNGPGFTTTTIKKDAYGDPRYALETRPKNYTVKVWRRTA